MRKQGGDPGLAATRAAFDLVLEQVEPAKAALADVVPGARMPGRPVHDALEEFESRLEAARSLMPAWRRPEVEGEWLACEAGLASALDLARGVREEGREAASFEGLLLLVQSLLDPLETFAEAEATLRALGRKGKRGHGESTG